MKLFYKYLIASFVMNAVLDASFTIARWLGGIGAEAAFGIIFVIACAAVAYRETAKAIPGAVVSA